MLTLNFFQECQNVEPIAENILANQTLVDTPRYIMLFWLLDYESSSFFREGIISPDYNPDDLRIKEFGQSQARD